MPKRASFALVWTLVAALAEAQVPLGPEFQVNSYTTFFQARPAVAATANGGFVVVWDSWTDVFAQRYDAAGAREGGEFRVNSYSTHSQGEPAVDSDPSGNFLVVWRSVQNGHFGVFGQRFDVSGVAQGGEFRVSEFTANDVGTPAVASDANGNFIVVWSGSGPDDTTGVFARRFSSTGSPIGGDFRVNSWTTAHQVWPDIASDPGGNFVVVWHSLNQPPDGSTYGVFAQRYDTTGAPQGAEFRVNSHTTLAQANAAVASHTNGDFVVVWQSVTQDGSNYGVFGQRFDASGAAQGAEFQVNTWTSNSQDAPDVDVDGQGNFVITWQSEFQGGLGYSIFGRTYEASGALPGNEFQVDSYVTAGQYVPTVAWLGNGTFVVAWTSESGQDGDEAGVFAQRFAPDLIFEDGFE